MQQYLNFLSYREFSRVLESLHSGIGLRENQKLIPAENVTTGPFLSGRTKAVTGESRPKAYESLLLYWRA